MADTAAHLVDRVFPDVPVRQWVLTLPYILRFRMAYDSRLVADVHRTRFNLVSYSGVLAPSSGLRKYIIPAKPADDSADDFSVCTHHKKTYASSFKSKANNGFHEWRYEWSELLKRFFGWIL
jgi:hypothetical protein